MKLFKAESGVFQPIQKRQFGFERLEKHLEDWLGANPHLLGDDILLIGRQVRTDHGIIDLLALDREGRAVVIELKRGLASREVVGQLNSYLTIVNRWSDRELERNANLVPYDREVSNLVRRFKEHFQVSAVPEFNREQVGVVVAEDFEPDFIAQISGLRFDCRVLQFSNFVTTADDEYLLINPLHDSAPPEHADEDDEDEEGGEAASVPADEKEHFSKLLDRVEGLLRDACPSEDGWRLHRSNRFVQGVFSCWKTVYEGISLYYDPKDRTLQVHTNCLPRHNRALSALLTARRREIEEGLGGKVSWDDHSWSCLYETVPDDPEFIAGRIRRYIEVLKPYLDEALPGRSKAARGGDITKTQLEFWTGFRKYATEAGSKLRFPALRPKGWMTINTGGFLYVAIASQNRITVYIALKGKDRKKNFELLKAEKDAIEAEFGAPLRWEPLPTKKESQVQTHSNGKLLDPSTWPETYKWMLDALERYHEIFDPRVKRLKLKP
ncbi:MAG: DUF4268 domain-containing protein [Bryobacteraceae bacterium]|nr:DUF4268 domain-containing protein [Bryobacteraceae bacterium]